MHSVSAQPRAPQATLQALQGACQQDRLCDGHAQQASILYQRGQYKEAILEFEAAFERTPLPVFLYNIARLHQQNGDLRQALAYYERHLNAQPADEPEKLSRSRSYKEQILRDFAKAEPVPVVQEPVKPESKAPPEAKKTTPLYKKWWLWTLVGVGVAGGITAAAVAGTWPKTPTDLERHQIMLQLRF